METVKELAVKDLSRFSAFKTMDAESKELVILSWVEGYNKGFDEGIDAGRTQPHQHLKKDLQTLNSYFQ